MTPPGEDVGEEIALAGTSLFIAIEQDRPLSSRPPDRVAVSVVTVAELRLGVLAAEDGPTRAQRLETLLANGPVFHLPPLGTVERRGPGEPRARPTDPLVATLQVQRHLGSDEVSELHTPLADTALPYRTNRVGDGQPS
ncbi:MAG: hypothetical protein ACRDZR_01575 [Acidimicrobiales bacterium]